jgi:hypothetical protein
MLKHVAVFMLSAAVLMFVPPALAGKKVEPPKIADDARNPPPMVALNAFQRFELAPVAMGEPWKDQKANELARSNLQANIDERANPLFAEWNAMPAGDAPRTLKVEPEIGYIRFITGGKRFFGGAFAGGSGILVKMKLTDAGTGEVIAEPQFYQSANAFSATYTFGAMDKHMLIRISAMVADYLKRNYEAPVGGAIMVAPGHEEQPEK